MCGDALGGYLAAGCARMDVGGGAYDWTLASRGVDRPGTDFRIPFSPAALRAFAPLTPQWGDELRAWHARVARLLERDDFALVCEPKIDGLAVSVIYRDGGFAIGATRGDVVPSARDGRRATAFGTGCIGGRAGEREGTGRRERRRRDGDRDPPRGKRLAVGLRRWAPWSFSIAFRVVL